MRRSLGWCGVRFAMLLAVAAGAGVSSGARAETPNYGPTPFAYYPPKIVTSVPGHEMMIFSWEASRDPEGGIIKYKLLLYQEGERIYVKDDIRETFFAVNLTDDVPGYRPNRSLQFTILALDPFWQEEQPMPAVPATRPERTEMLGASTVTIPGYLWGYVYDARTQMPVRDAVIYTPNSSTVIEDGSYGMEVQAGRFSLVVSAPNFETFTTELEVPEGEVVLYNIPLQQSFFSYRATLWGAVKDRATGQPIRDARLSYGESDISVDGGSYLLTLPEGRYTLQCEAPGFHAKAVDVMLRRNETVLQDLVLEAIDEHVWAERDMKNDPRYMQVYLSGMSGRYDVYIVAQLPTGTVFSLTDIDGSWGPPDAILPIVSDATVGDGGYRVMLARTAAQLAATNVSVFVVCTRPGVSPADPLHWETSAIIGWGY